MASIDLNCDLGEFPDRSGADAALLDVVTSANIACGGHAGDERTMTETVRAAIARGVAIGAHPSYPDRANFGRTALPMTAEEIERSVADQIRALARIASSLGAGVTHVKPHGALYHAAMTRADIAEAIARAVIEATGSDRPGTAPVLVGLAGAGALGIWQRLGLRTAAEAFADRRYEPDASLRSRSLADSLIADPDGAADQAIQIARDHRVTTSTGVLVPVTADTICIHGDTPNAVTIARSVRTALESAGFRITPIAGAAI